MTGLKPLFLGHRLPKLADTLDCLHGMQDRAQEVERTRAEVAYESLEGLFRLFRSRRLGIGIRRFSERCANLRIGLWRGGLIHGDQTQVAVLVARILRGGIQLAVALADVVLGFPVVRYATGLLNRAFARVISGQHKLGIAVVLVA